MSAHDGWTGPMTGPMRGVPLVRCPAHPAIWHHQGERCPVCERDETIAALERQVRELKARTA